MNKRKDALRAALARTRARFPPHRYTALRTHAHTFAPYAHLTTFLPHTPRMPQAAWVYCPHYTRNMPSAISCLSACLPYPLPLASTIAGGGRNCRRVYLPRYGACLTVAAPRACPRAANRRHARLRDERGDSSTYYYYTTFPPRCHTTPTTPTNLTRTTHTYFYKTCHLPALPLPTPLVGLGAHLLVPATGEGGQTGVPAGYRAAAAHAHLHFCCWTSLTASLRTYTTYRYMPLLCAPRSFLPLRTAASIRRDHGYRLLLVKAAVVANRYRWHLPPWRSGAAGYCCAKRHSFP